MLVAKTDGSQVYYCCDDRPLDLAVGLQFFEDCLNIIDFRMNADTDDMIIECITRRGGNVEENIQKYKDFRYEDHDPFKNAFFNKLIVEEDLQVD